MLSLYIAGILQLASVLAERQGPWASFVTRVTCYGLYYEPFFNSIIGTVSQDFGVRIPNLYEIVNEIHLSTEIHNFEFRYFYSVYVSIKIKF